LQLFARVEISSRWGRDHQSATSRYKRHGLIERGTADFAVTYKSSSNGDGVVPHDLAILSPDLIRLVSVTNEGARRTELPVTITVHGLLATWNYQNEVDSNYRCEQLIVDMVCYRGEMSPMLAFWSLLNGKSEENDLLAACDSSFQRVRASYDESVRQARRQEERKSRGRSGPR
jgi:hypothetical protein